MHLTRSVDFPSFGARPHRPFQAPQTLPAAPTSALLQQVRVLAFAAFRTRVLSACARPGGR
jgi:hypothetical protein